MFEVMNAPMPLRPDTLPQQALQLSKEELATGTLSKETRALAGLILSTRGYVILKDALSQEFIQQIGREVTEIYDDCRATLGTEETGTDADALHSVRVGKLKRASFWYRKARWRIFPWLTAPMSDPRLLANPYVVPILEDLLGRDFYCKYVSSDTCLDGSILQSPHSDIDNNDVMVNNRWQARGYIVNIPVMECGLHNGPLEVWPGGSHMWTSDLLEQYGLEPNIQDGRNPPVERVAEYLPSVKVVLLPGEILIRDLAMWHRGTPNPTDKPRTMLTLGFFRGNHPYGYGDASFNLDREAFRQLHPRIRKMFDYHFNLRSSLKRKQKAIRSAAKSWIKSRLPGGGS
jgi:ectoine hydroxylase-related dioxygenase (phytanoyl-CoA dioxygenase family)